MCANGFHRQRPDSVLLMFGKRAISKALSAFAITGLVCAFPLPASAQGSAPTVTVWDFTARDSASAELTQSYTDAFELALSQQRSIRVVERRRFDRFRSKVLASRTIAELLGVQPDVIASGRTAGVGAFVFGEVFDDQQGGEFHIAVTVEQLDTVILAREDVFIRRGTRSDPVSRRSAMEELARKVATRLGTSRAEAPPLARVAEPITRAAFEDRYVRMVLTSLTAGDTVSVGLSVQNLTNGPLRLSSSACLMWQLVDANGSQFRLVNSMGLSHQQCGEGGINTGQAINESRFIEIEPGVPVSVVLQFRSYSGRGVAPFTITGELIRSAGRGHQTFAVVLQGLVR